MSTTVVLHPYSYSALRCPWWLRGGAKDKLTKSKRRLAVVGVWGPVRQPRREEDGERLPVAVAVPFPSPALTPVPERTSSKQPPSPGPGASPRPTPVPRIPSLPDRPGLSPQGPSGQSGHASSLWCSPVPLASPAARSEARTPGSRPHAACRRDGRDGQSTDTPRARAGSSSETPASRTTTRDPRPLHRPTDGWTNLRCVC